MGVKVVSPLWVEQCRATKSIANERDFLVGALPISLPPAVPVTVTGKPLPLPLKEPEKDPLRHVRSLDSPHFSSSKRERAELAEEDGEGQQLLQLQ
jgi:hypothetical protein